MTQDLEEVGLKANEDKSYTDRLRFHTFGLLLMPSHRNTGSNMKA